MPHMMVEHAIHDGRIECRSRLGALAGEQSVEAGAPGRPSLPGDSAGPTEIAQGGGPPCAPSRPERPRRKGKEARRQRERGSWVPRMNRGGH